MEPVEINAGEYYLRQLRVDDRIDDRPALSRFATPEQARAHIERRANEWETDAGCSWAVCEQLSNTAVGEVAVSATGELFCWISPQHRGKGIATHCVEAVAGFAFGFLDLESLTTTPCDKAAERVAQKCGFTAGSSHGVWTRLR
ncbi:GNAT family N-acetyltransferase [Saccharothrix variisporea]|uniref:Acetyltransferase (GNAT) family protein n=1 Tax=Saccharothrix variisporea TaxID=543527 RepID=A0A495XIM4_9PSEU|nr:GNAT family N-acetyltransferase [Saccharothrix variisporea]RKT72353.1 acetyltransferase (GNAT) family protein [Saccharothrix variisporea]